MGSPGGMCPAHSKGTTGSGTVGNAAQTNPAMVELLEGQAFYAALAPSQYSLPTTSSTAATQTARAAKQKQCATHITSMMKLNKATAVTAEAGKFGHSYSAINFPLWKVGIGAGTTRTSTLCLTVTATLMPALTTSPRSVRNPPSRGLRSWAS